jgi:hypothetical protein
MSMPRDSDEKPLAFSGGSCLNSAQNAVRLSTGRRRGRTVPPASIVARSGRSLRAFSKFLRTDPVRAVHRSWRVDAATEHQSHGLPFARPCLWMGLRNCGLGDLGASRFFAACSLGVSVLVSALAGWLLSMNRPPDANWRSPWEGGPQPAERAR